MDTASTPQQAQWNPELYDGKHAFVWKYGADLVAALGPKPGERILDVGCGTGHLTARIAEPGADVVGIDSAAGMVAQARKVYPSLRFEVADAREMAFNSEFDAVFSNAALHWMKPPERAAAAMFRALRPGGRLVAEFGGKGNVRSIADAVEQAVVKRGSRWVSPWYFPDPEEYSALLAKHGFRVLSASLTSRPTPLDGGTDGLRLWLDMFGGVFLAGLTETQKADVVEQVEDALRPTLFRDSTWVADYVRLRVAAVKPA
ncbi:MAG: class I SAM-dependent methyltransferase [SAR202 cluster bacterium]|nr:class I SAM-dependent methyltransferase [SAR202 cluster bacterium]